MNIIPGTPADNTNRPQADMPFTQEDLELQWLSMCNRMPQAHSGIATRMKNMTPQIKDMPHVEVIVDNALVKQDMEPIYKSILKTLQVYLHNSQLSLDIIVTDKPSPVKILTRREQFDVMREQNPAVEALLKAFDLELA